ncbi:MFS transporter [Myroides sp. 1354]|uniref:MFS transporter n=1 Tax=unclassified Myroides TaxID=2642485 RepID=UPI0025772B14|nr:MULTISPECIES: MFS transporter [unclassified Myroides]MDM1044823.1 MFS transporter [Myroides sp. R163-1]MDM1055536.1 MFS transporter [Myroides sp. 1354]MDM1068833.1 MFS transporter [Myroides sp. 1372]
MNLKLNKLWIVILIVALNSIGFSIVIPLLPFLLEDYLPSNQIVFGMGLLFSIYAICSFITAPILGALSDKYGRKPILIISLLGSVLGYVFLGIGGALWVLFLGRIIDGLTAGNISVLFAYIADNSKQEERSKWYGYIGAAMGIGKIGGPTLGALLSTISLALPFYLTAFLLFISTLAVYFFLPESLAVKLKDKKIELNNLNPFKLLLNTFSIKPLKHLLLIGVLFYIVLTVFQFNMTLFLKDIYSLNTLHIGILLTIVGIVEIVSRGFLLPFLLKIYSQRTVTTIGLLTLIVGFSCIVSSIYINSLALISLALIFIILGEGLFEPTYLSKLSEQTSADDQGKIQGINQSLQALITIIIPIIASAVYFQSASLLYLSTILILGIALLLFYKLIR